MNSEDSTASQKGEAEHLSSHAPPQDGASPPVDDGGEMREGAENDFPLADTISTTTLVNLLVRKGVLSIDELLEEESKYLAWGNVSEERVRSRVSRRKSTKWRRLKRIMSRRRWTRRLSTALFGWRWKKIRSDSHS